MHKFLGRHGLPKLTPNVNSLIISIFIKEIEFGSLKSLPQTIVQAQTTSLRTLPSTEERNANNSTQIIPENWSDASQSILKTNITVILKPDKDWSNIPHKHRIFIKLQKSYSVVLAS